MDSGRSDREGYRGGGGPSGSAHAPNPKGRPPGGVPPGGPGRPAGPPPPPRPRVVLPFESSASDPATWVYEHQIGLLSMIVALLIFGIVFVTAQIVIAPAQYVHTIYMSLEDQRPQPEQRPLTAEERQQFEESLRNARNQISNEGSSREAQQQGARNRMYDEGASDNPISSDMAQRAQEVQDRVRASRDAYEQGLRDEQAMIAAARGSGRGQGQGSGSQGEDLTSAARGSGNQGQGPKPQEQAKVKGNVIISFSLDGRSFVYMHVPAYQCEGGGEVVVSITVNRNGRVTSSSIQSATTSDDCITSRALEAAQLSRFNTDGSASERQQGTITYLFVPQ